MLSAAAFNALLKTLEEPPPHVVFVLATTEAHKVLPTIVSRTQRFDFRRVTSDILTHHLDQIAKMEEIAVEAGALAIVARHSEGSVRDALSVLDQLSSLGGTVTEEDVEGLLGMRAEDAIGELFDAIAGGEVASLFQTLHQLVSQGADIRQLALNVVGHARSLLLLRTAPNAEDLLEESQEDAALLRAQSEKFTAGSLLRTLDLVSKAVTEMRNSPEHRLLLEVALVRAAAPETDPSATGLLGRIERLERRIGIASQADDVQQPSVAQPSPDRAPSPAPAAPAQSPPASQVATPSPTRGQDQEPSAPQPVEQAPAASAQPGNGVPAEIGLAHVKDAWPATLKEVNKRSKRVWGLLSPSRAVSFDGTTLHVEVQSDFHKSSMDDQRNKEVLQASLHAALGITLELDFVSRTAAGDVEQPAVQDEVEDMTSAAPAESQDPVELLKQGLSAEVVEEKQRS